MDSIGKELVVYWNKKVPNTELERFQKNIEKKYTVKFETYWDLHRWTVKNYPKFVEELWIFFDIIYSEPYKEVFTKTGPGFLDNEWFTEAKLNFAENMLRIRDDRVALICLDELGNEDTVTYAEIFEEVKLYAAAFRKNGLKVGDRIACFMPNRKEAIFAWFASASIGALWGGAVPYYGAKGASNIVSAMDPKFLITIDRHQDNGIIFPTLDYLPEIVQHSPNLKKVILVVTHGETRKKDLSNIPNCTFLEDFLKEGRTEEGKVPDIFFEQLPAHHPLCINFTSGTTGTPKALIRSVGMVFNKIMGVDGADVKSFTPHQWQASVLTVLGDFAFIYNLKCEDVLCMNYTAGWATWNHLVPGLSLGISFFLYSGSTLYTVNGKNFWDLQAKYKVNSVSLVPSMVDQMEKMNMAPSPETDLSCLKIIKITASPVKQHNIAYIQNRITKNAYVGIVYAATEMFGCFAAFNINMPTDTGEIQVPALGVDLQCFDSMGNSVVGQRGETVICSPAINFPIGLWKDDNKASLSATYLSKFPGVWTQHDECWINPKTRGIVVIGRSDDTLKQQGMRFGAADVYFAIHSLNELQDYICVSQRKHNGGCRAVLFVKMRQGMKFTSEIKAKIGKKVDEELWELCVPELILETPDIPYNLNNKRMESLVRKIIQDNTIPDVMNIRNPECLKHFVNIPEILNYSNL